MLRLAKMLAPAIRKKDTKYKLAILVPIRLACTLFKLSHTASFLICSKMFVVGRSTVSMMLRDVVHAISVSLRNEIRWPWGEHIFDMAWEFQQVCGLSGIIEAIDGMHIAIAKPRHDAPDYFYFKSSSYTMN